MLTRITLLIGMFTAMGFGGFMTGQHSNVQRDHGAGSDLPHEHPISLALESKTELKLSAEQIVRLENLRAAMSKEMIPVHARAQDIHGRAAKAHQTGDSKAMEQIEREMKSLESAIKPTFERFAQEAVKILTPQQHERLAQIVNARMADHGARDFVLLFVMHSREQLGISPQQFTKLQYLQADFIRSFAPLREKMEMLHMQMRGAGNEPPRAMVETATSLEKQIKQMQAIYSNRALQEVLNSEQRQQLEQLLRNGGQGDGGGHHSGGGHGGGQHGAGGHGGG